MLRRVARVLALRSKKLIIYLFAFLAEPDYTAFKIFYGLNTIVRGMNQ